MVNHKTDNCKNQIVAFQEIDLQQSFHSFQNIMSIFANFYRLQLSLIIAFLAEVYFVFISAITPQGDKFLW